MLAGFSLFLGSFLAIFGLVLYIGRANQKRVGKKNKVNSHSAPLSRSTHPYRCVEIEPCLGACEKVKPYKNIKILLDKAPSLPLRGCDHKRCECKFVRFNDRRDSDRRDKNSVRDSIAILQEKSSKERAWPDRRRTKQI